VTSFLEDKGIPGVVERTLIRPPSSQLGPIDAGVRAVLMAGSPIAGKYEAQIDRDSAYERLRARADAAAKAAAAEEAEEAKAAQDAKELRTDAREFKSARRYDGGPAAKPATRRSTRASRSGGGDSVGEAFAKSFARQLGTRSGQAVVRGILGSLFKKR
jgi:hypothetical protein